MRILIFVDLMITGLLTRAMFAVWAESNPMEMSAAVYVAQQRAAIRGFNTLLPLLGLACLTLSLAWAIWSRRDGVCLGLCLGAVAGLAVAGLIRRFCNQPIHAQLMSWRDGFVPPGWMELKDTWLHWHIARMACVIAAYALSLGAALRPRRSEAALTHVGQIVSSPRRFLAERMTQ